MPSKIKRRSGNAVAEFCAELGWQPDFVVQIGIGLNHEEVDVFREHWPGVRVVGCEPHPEIVREIRGRGYLGEVIPVAVSDRTGPVRLMSKSQHKDGSSLFPLYNRNPRNDYSEILVQAMTLDDLLLAHGPFGSDSLLWLDCEGAEARALRGGPRFLASVAAVNVEMTCRPLGEGWARPAEVDALLREAGFAQAWCHTNRIHARQFDAVYVRREMLRPDLCMCLAELRG